MTKSLVPETLKHLPKSYNKGLVEFIVDKIEDGESLRQICIKYKDIVPPEKTIYRWKKKYPELKAALEQAYQTYLYRQLDELDELSKISITVEKSMKELSELPPNQKRDWLYAHRAQLDVIRQRIDVLKFSLAKLAPKFVPELKDPVTAQIAVVPTIQIVQYSKDSPSVLDNS